MINKAISNQTHISPVETCFGVEAQIQAPPSNKFHFEAPMKNAMLNSL